MLYVVPEKFQQVFAGMKFNGTGTSTQDQRD
jgi:hypothetical protein